MPDVLAIGPLAVNAHVLVALAALLIGLMVTQGVARHLKTSDAGMGWLLLLAVVIARGSFLLRHLQEYREAPLSLFNLRDGGWDPISGWVAALLAMLWLTLRRRRRSLPLWAGLLSITLVAAGGQWFLWVQSRQHALSQPALQRLPPMTLPALDGGMSDLRQWPGKPLLINFWASWCGPCVREMPILMAARQRYGNVQFVFVNQGESPAQVRTFLQREDLPTQDVLLDTQLALGRFFDVRGYPSTLLFDSSGQKIASWQGEFSQATLAEFLRALSAPAVASASSP
ncbi:TlpA disulfide reductase family protein [uncultured Herbaspirillum sp.]|uniref:TlpA family protein disulfide reductase n=1 Tax=uncultured Herbaspirillum sp. TaxID=160236 RepID=UPI00260543E7|nr:TlpA disulfide reductase family protein [uncultured Herbaspirillum sp.]